MTFGNGESASARRVPSVTLRKPSSWRRYIELTGRRLGTTSRRWKTQMRTRAAVGGLRLLAGRCAWRLAGRKRHHRHLARDREWPEVLATELQLRESRAGRRRVRSTARLGRWSKSRLLGHSAAPSRRRPRPKRAQGPVYLSMGVPRAARYGLDHRQSRHKRTQPVASPRRARPRLRPGGLPRPRRRMARCRPRRIDRPQSFRSRAGPRTPQASLLEPRQPSRSSRRQARAGGLESSGNFGPSHGLQAPRPRSGSTPGPALGPQARPGHRRVCQPRPFVDVVPHAYTGEMRSWSGWSASLVEGPSAAWPGPAQWLCRAL